MRIADAHLEKKSEILEHELKDIERQILALQQEQRSYQNRINQRQSGFQAIFRQIEKEGVLSKNADLFMRRMPEEQKKLGELRLSSSRLQERVDKVLRTRQERENTLAKLSTMLAERKQQRQLRAEQEELDEQIPHRINSRRIEQKEVTRRTEISQEKRGTEQEQPQSRESTGKHSEHSKGNTRDDDLSGGRNAPEKGHAEKENPQCSSDCAGGLQDRDHNEISDQQEPIDDNGGSADIAGIEELESLSLEYARGVRLIFTSSTGKRIELEVLQVEKRRLSLFLFPLDKFSDQAIKEAKQTIRTRLEQRGFVITDLLVV